MRNLLNIPLEHSDLYDKAASQWRDKVVGGFTVMTVGLGMGLLVEASKYSGEMKDILAFATVISLGGAGIAGYGIAELNKTSDELAQRTSHGERTE